MFDFSALEEVTGDKVYILGGLVDESIQKVGAALLISTLSGLALYLVMAKSDSFCTIKARLVSSELNLTAESEEHCVTFHCLVVQKFCVCFVGWRRDDLQRHRNNFA